MTHTNKGALSEEQLKERLNFSKMFNRQAGQIQQTKHIKNLLNPVSEEANNKINSSHPEESNDRDNSKAILDKIDNLENNLILKINKLEQKNLKSIITDFMESRQSRHIPVALILGSLIIGISLLSNPTEVVTKEKIVYKTQEIQPKALYILTKFVNVRQTPSTKGIKLNTLPPNSNVKILKESKGWKKIQFKNYVEDKIVIGWIYGENLKKVLP